MRNWNYDGWTSEDWDKLDVESGDLRSIAAQFDNAVGGGGGGFQPGELSEVIDRMLASAERLKRIRANYL